MNKSCRWIEVVGAGILLTVSIVRADPLNSIAKELAKGIKKLPGDRVAVLLFPYENGDVSTGSTLISERLTSLLAQRPKIRVIERSLLAGVLSEVRLEESGVTASTGTPKIGELEGVDALITGTLTDLPDDVTVVNARMIQFPSGEILAAVSADINRTWEDIPHTPPVPAGETDEDDKPYVLNASPLIYTPSARPIRPVPVMAEASAPSYNNRGEGSQTMTQPVSLPAAPYPSSVIIVGRPSPPRRRAAGVNDQLLYAMGLTLDVQGHPHQAARFYRSLVEGSPRTSPLREKAKQRLDH